MLFGVDGNKLDPDALATFARLRKRDHDEMLAGINELIAPMVERVRRDLELQRTQGTDAPEEDS